MLSDCHKLWERITKADPAASASVFDDQGHLPPLPTAEADTVASVVSTDEVAAVTAAVGASPSRDEYKRQLAEMKGKCKAMQLRLHSQDIERQAVEKRAAIAADVAAEATRRASL